MREAVMNITMLKQN